MVMEAISVMFQGDTVGAISFDTDRGLGAFEYAPAFIAKALGNCSWSFDRSSGIKSL